MRSLRRCIDKIPRPSPVVPHRRGTPITCHPLIADRISLSARHQRLSYTVLVPIKSYRTPIRCPGIPTLPWIPQILTTRPDKVAFHPNLVHPEATPRPPQRTDDSLIPDASSPRAASICKKKYHRHQSGSGTRRGLTGSTSSQR
jgi:hypothetical protein